MNADEIVAAEKALQKLDPILGAHIVQHGSIVRHPRRDYFASLVRAIIGQQLSVVAAARIYERFENATGLEPGRTVRLQEPETKAIGLSASKTRYIKDVAQHFIKDQAVFNHLETLHDDDVIKELTEIKGIGVWTAQMFLMFTLIRPDVFAPDDAGLQRAIKTIYGFTETSHRTELETFAERWKPYRTVASWHLWCSLENGALALEKI
jgi:DNA-3-methyladenine glycosylase II